MEMEMEMAMAKPQQLGGGGGGGGGGGPNYSNWEGMLKRLNSDGTYRSPLSDVTTTHPRSAPKWRGEAQKLFMTHPPPPDYDIDDRVFDISCELIQDLCSELAPQGEVGKEEEEEEEDLTYKEALYNPEHVEELLDELKAYVESVDVALLLHSEYHLYPLLIRVLYNRYPNIRAKAAEFVTAMVQNYPTSQQFVLTVNGLGLVPFVFNFTSDPDVTSRTKALGAISALIRNNESGITAFRLAKGYEALKDALIPDTPLQRDALNLIEYLLHEKRLDCNIVTKVTELGLPRIMVHLASSDDAEVRVAALRGLLVLARDEEGGDSGQLVKNDEKLKQVLQERIEGNQGISTMTPEDARKEIQLVDSLWNVCYSEPSSLGEKGLLVLPGEDAPVPDVASKLFEPPLRASAAAEAVDRNLVIEKDYNIVTDLGLPCIMIHLASSDAAKVREAALKGLLVLTRDEEGGVSGQLVKNDDKLKQVLQERIEEISAMAPEDLGVARREIQLVYSLWDACYNEPSSLGEKGLLVLPGEDVPAPDVASKLFEPPAAEAADRNSLSEKEDPSAATHTDQSKSISKRRKFN